MTWGARRGVLIYRRTNVVLVFLDLISSRSTREGCLPSRLSLWVEGCALVLPPGFKLAEEAAQDSPLRTHCSRHVASIRLWIWTSRCTSGEPTSRGIRNTQSTWHRYI